MDQRSVKSGSDHGHVFITGANRGIGACTALALATYGFDVTAGMRDLRNADALHSQGIAGGGRIVSVQVDVDDRASVERAVAEAESRGPLVAVVNNAGLMRRGPIETLEDSTLLALLSTNTLGPLRVVRAVLPYMRSRKAGVIVNVSSAGGYVAAPFQGAYAASKHALEALSMSLRAEVAPFGIRVAVIEPGQYETPMRADHLRVDAIGPDSPYRPSFEVWESRANRGRSKDPDEVALAIVAAIVDPSTALRIPVGQDAVTLAEMAGREQLARLDDHIDRSLTPPSATPKEQP